MFVVALSDGTPIPVKRIVPAGYSPTSTEKHGELGTGLATGSAILAYLLGNSMKSGCASRPEL